MATVKEIMQKYLDATYDELVEVAKSALLKLTPVFDEADGEGQGARPWRGSKVQGLGPCVHTHTYTPMHTETHMHIGTQIYTNAHEHVHTGTHTEIQTCTPRHTPTHTHRLKKRE